MQAVRGDGRKAPKNPAKRGPVRAVTSPGGPEIEASSPASDAGLVATFDVAVIGLHPWKNGGVTR